MKGNEDTFHVLLSTDERLQVKTVVALINSNKSEKLLGVKNDNRLTFDDDFRSIRKKASVKLKFLSRVAKCMCPEKKALNHVCFFSAKFNCCSLI